MASHLTPFARVEETKFLPGFWVYDANGMFRLDQRAAETLGAETDSVSAESLLDRCDETFVRVMRSILSGFESGDILLEHTYLRKGGKKVGIYFQGSVLRRRDDGVATLGSGFVAEMETPFTAIAMRENSGEGVWEWNGLSGVVRFSQSYGEMLGYASPRELPSSIEEWALIVHPEDRESVNMQLRLCADPAYGDSFECCLRLRRRDGQYIWTIGKGQVVQRNHEGRAIRLIGTNVNIELFKKYNEMALDKLYTDPLTGAYNRLFFKKRLPALCRDTVQRPLAVLYMDISGLKMVNDLAGHAYGDALIKAAINIVNCSVEKEKYVIRMGGDEFLIIIPRCPDWQMREYLRCIAHLADVYNTDAIIPLLFGVGGHILDSDDLVTSVFCAEEEMRKDKLAGHARNYLQLRGALELLLGKSVRYQDSRLTEDAGREE